MNAYLIIAGVQDMNPFFIIAGVTVTILGILAIVVVSAVFIYVRVLGCPLVLRYVKNKRK